MSLHSRPVTDDDDRRPNYSRIRNSCQLYPSQVVDFYGGRHGEYLYSNRTQSRSQPLTSFTNIHHQTHPTTSTHLQPPTNHEHTFQLKGLSLGCPLGQRRPPTSVSVHQIRTIITSAIGFSELKHLNRKATVKALCCVVFTVATAVGYSKGQMSNL